MIWGCKREDSHYLLNVPLGEESLERHTPVDVTIEGFGVEGQIKLEVAPALKLTHLDDGL